MGTGTIGRSSRSAQRVGKGRTAPDESRKRDGEQGGSGRSGLESMRGRKGRKTSAPGQVGKRGEHRAQARGKPPAPPCRDNTQKARRRVDCGESAGPRAWRSRRYAKRGQHEGGRRKAGGSVAARRFAARQDDERERSGNSRRRRPTGNPMTVSRSPSTRATRSAPAPCTAYAPALSNDSPFRR